MQRKVLNRVLYNRLLRLFEKTAGVVVANDGEKMISSHVRSFRSFGDRRDPELRVDSPGEYYRVCCPFCNDRRHRLWINHMWGVPDSVTGNKNLWLAVCYNENCLSDARNRLDLYEDVFAMESYFRPLNLKIVPGKPPGEARNATIVMPGAVTTLDRLEPSHPANVYMAERGFEPEMIGRFYGVGYCADSVYWLARHRIVVPVRMAGKLIGWQTRFIGEPSDEKYDGPKWWTCPGMKTGRALYNFDEACNYKTCVVVEGAADVWSVGPMAVATFSSTPKTHQLSMVARMFRGGSVVLMPDSDVLDDKKKSADLEKGRLVLKSSVKHGVAVVRLPDGTDPGGLDRSVLRRFITRAAKSQGVPVSFKRKGQ